MKRMASSGVRENRETQAKTQPFRAEYLRRGGGGGNLGGNHKPEAIFEKGELMAEDILQASLDLVPDNGRSDPAGNDGGSLGFP